MALVTALWPPLLHGLIGVLATAFATDWRKKWPACARHAEAAPEPPQ